ncbi:unnamed protein product [Colias eurytheme]|nr:unnamed protein product [Colias eurytheme]
MVSLERLVGVETGAEGELDGTAACAVQRREQQPQRAREHSAARVHPHHAPCAHPRARAHPLRALSAAVVHRTLSVRQICFVLNLAGPQIKTVPL